MAHFGVICPPASSHVTGMTAIGRELIGRGHRVTMFNIEDARELTASEGVEFHQIGIEDHPAGSLVRFSQDVAKLHGLAALRFGIETATREAATQLRDLPDAMRSRGVSAIIGDQGAPVCSSIAERLGIPFVSICNAVPANRDPTLPPPFTGWSPGPGPVIRLRNVAANRVVDFTVQPITRVVNRYRAQWGLPLLQRLEQTFSPLAQISQQTEDFDFPNPSKPANFHHVGMLRRASNETTPFPFDRLGDRPVIYASLGTLMLMGRAPAIHRKLAHACGGLPVQLVITLGGAEESAEHADLPGNPIVVRRAPQLAVLQRSALTFCHGGLNTVLESLSFGVPVLAMPGMTDQFAVGARLRRSGAGEIVTQREFDSPHLRETISRLLTEPTYRQRAMHIADSFRQAGGEKRAADIILGAIAPTASASRSLPPAP